MENNPSSMTLLNLDDLDDILGKYGNMLHATLELYEKLKEDVSVTRDWNVRARGANGGRIEIEAKEDVVMGTIKLLMLHLKTVYGINFDHKQAHHGAFSWSPNYAYYTRTNYSDWEQYAPWIEISSRRIVGCKIVPVDKDNEPEYKVICESEQP